MFTAADVREWVGPLALAEALAEGRHVFPPGVLVEIYGEEPTGLVGQEWVDPDHVPALQVIGDGTVGERGVGLVGAFAALDLPHVADARLPEVRADRGIALLAGLAFPSPRVDVFPAAEEAPEEPD